MVKKLLFFSLIIVVLAFFTLPQLIFADEGDASTYVGVRDKENNGGVYTGQYVLGDEDDTIKDTENDGDTDVYCIDGDTYVNQGDNKYSYTGKTASEDLADEIGEEDALAAEILAKNKTGASTTEDQVAMWEITDDSKDAVYNSLSQEEKENVDDIVDAAKDLADKAGDDPSVLDDINDVEVVLDDEPMYDESTGDANEHTAEAIMAEPFVPGITDGEEVGSNDPDETIGDTPAEITATGAKTVFWYILEGSYNVSFSETELVTETTSGMFDYTDDGTDPDDDGDDSTDDHYGKASINYYFFHWGGDYPENEEMKANIGAWVDIDEDEKLDVVDTTAEGTVVDNIQEELAVVKVTDGKVDIDDNDTPGDYTDDTVETEQLPDSAFDVKKVEGGGVIKSNRDINEGRDGPGNESPDIRDQRFVTDAASEPFDTASETYEAWAEVEIQKTDATSGSPLEGSTFQLYRVLTEFDAELIDEVVLDPGSNGYYKWDGLYWGTYFVRETVAPEGYLLAPDGYTTVGYEEAESLLGHIEEDIADPRIPGSITVYKYSGSTPLAGAVFDVVSADGTFSTKITSGADGYASISGLEWGTYYVKEVVAPDGYDIDPNTYTLVLGQTALSAAKDIEDDPITPPVTPPVTPPTVEVAGINEIEVLGISEELPFTGLDPKVPIAGASLLLAGFALLAVSLVRRKKTWKHAIGHNSDK